MAFYVKRVNFYLTVEGALVDWVEEDLGVNFLVAFFNYLMVMQQKFLECLQVLFKCLTHHLVMERQQFECLQVLFKCHTHHSEMEMEQDLFQYIHALLKGYTQLQLVQFVQALVKAFIQVHQYDVFKVKNHYDVYFYQSAEVAEDFVYQIEKAMNY
ncbi:unnamed protein product [Paramecium octaurelia]|uniref:Uncharacterized protein n=1 Tax=Paramecium octaurelia TaxID=43137 RepID=A0A8S1VYC0_PAROT|nr:unnamed protein product [Paramecium octaurelia]